MKKFVKIIGNSLNFKTVRKKDNSFLNKRDIKSGTQKMEKQEKNKVEASSILNSLQFKQNSKTFSK